MSMTLDILSGLLDTSGVSCFLVIKTRRLDMTTLDDTDTGRRLGPGFWAMWTLAMGATIAALLAAVVYSKTQMTGVASTVAGGASVVVFTLILIGVGMAPRTIRVRRGSESPMRPAMRRYLWRFLPAMLGYVVLLLTASTIWKTYEPSGLLAWIIALSPAAPVLLGVRAIGLLIREETDEVQVARLSYAYRWATMATLSVCTVWGFLEMFGLTPQVELWAVFPIWALALGPGQLIACRQIG